MPSEQSTDERVASALKTLEPARESYHSALVATAEELRAMLEAGSSTAEARAARTAAELGAFAVGHIDVERFAAFEQTGEPVAVSVAPRLEAATRTLKSLLDAGSDLYHARVDPGGDLRDTVAEALARAGRAFGAARTVELARAGTYDESLHGSWLDRFPASLWSRRERALSPPVVVEVDGADLRPGGLADLLDGKQKIVLFVRGPMPPAALAPLITPGVVVVQSSDPSDVAAVAEAEGPAIAAIVPEDACRFVHFPGVDGGRGRLVIDHMAAERPAKPIGTISAFRQAEAIQHLASLAAGWGIGSTGAVAPVEGGEAAPAAAADVLAAWILRQADLQGTG